MIRRRAIGSALILLLGPGVVDLGAQSPSGDPALRMGEGTGQYWYRGRQLRRPLVVVVPGDAARCGGQRVAFDAGEDGSVSPAVAVPAWDGDRCVAESWWSLGETIGIQHARAHLVGREEEPVTFQAVARQGARIFFGGAWTPREEGWVQRVESDDGPDFLREVDPSGVFRAVVGVDFPLWPAWRRVRAAVGANAQEIDRYFYFGVSALQGLVFGPGQEGSAVDVHVGFQLSRRDVGFSGPVCAPEPVCTERDLRFSGLTILVTVDGASAFRGLAGAVLR